ncbi:cardiomyopathy-associated protein 5 [Macrotis lagotis]|uniref:cardiomyopathy-associated protein 5 n=1 Tax=Macrotis lagotis TaxID=92651 RepID=UPI003D68D90A
MESAQHRPAPTPTPESYEGESEGETELETELETEESEGEEEIPVETEEELDSSRFTDQNEEDNIKQECIISDPSFSMVTVQREDSGITWETSSSRSSTPWASESSLTSDMYSMEGSTVSSPPGNISFILNEGKKVRKRAHKSSSKHGSPALRRKGGKKRHSLEGQADVPTKAKDKTSISDGKSEQEKSPISTYDRTRKKKTVSSTPPITGAIYKEHKPLVLRPVYIGTVQYKIKMFNSVKEEIIPLQFYGTLPKGYVIKEINYRKGKDASITLEPDGANQNFSISSKPNKSVSENLENNKEKQLSPPWREEMSNKSRPEPSFLKEIEKTKGIDSYSLLNATTASELKHTVSSNSSNDAMEPQNLSSFVSSLPVEEASIHEVQVDSPDAATLELTSPKMVKEELKADTQQTGVLSPTHSTSPSFADEAGEEERESDLLATTAASISETLTSTKVEGEAFESDSPVTAASVPSPLSTKVENLGLSSLEKEEPISSTSEREMEEAKPESSLPIEAESMHELQMDSQDVATSELMSPKVMKEDLKADTQQTGVLSPTLSASPSFADEIGKEERESDLLTTTAASISETLTSTKAEGEAFESDSPVTAASVPSPLSTKVENLGLSSLEKEEPIPSTGEREMEEAKPESSLPIEAKSMHELQMDSQDVATSELMSPKMMKEDLKVDTQQTGALSPTLSTSPSFADEIGKEERESDLLTTTAASISETLTSTKAEGEAFESDSLVTTESVPGPFGEKGLGLSSLEEEEELVSPTGEGEVEETKPESSVSFSGPPVEEEIEEEEGSVSLPITSGPELESSYVSEEEIIEIDYPESPTPFENAIPPHLVHEREKEGVKSDLPPLVTSTDEHVTLLEKERKEIEPISPDSDFASEFSGPSHSTHELEEKESKPVSPPAVRSPSEYEILSEEETMPYSLEFTSVSEYSTSPTEEEESIGYKRPTHSASTSEAAIFSEEETLESERYTPDSTSASEYSIPPYMAQESQKEASDQQTPQSSIATTDHMIISEEEKDDIGPFSPDSAFVSEYSFSPHTVQESEKEEFERDYPLRSTSPSEHIILTEEENEETELSSPDSASDFSVPSYITPEPEKKTNKPGPLQTTISVSEYATFSETEKEDIKPETQATSMPIPEHTILSQGQKVQHSSSVPGSEQLNMPPSAAEVGKENVKPNSQTASISVSEYLIMSQRQTIEGNSQVLKFENSIPPSLADESEKEEIRSDSSVPAFMKADSSEKENIKQVLPETSVTRLQESISPESTQEVTEELEPESVHGQKGAFEHLAFSKVNKEEIMPNSQITPPEHPTSMQHKEMEPLSPRALDYVLESSVAPGGAGKKVVSDSMTIETPVPHQENSLKEEENLKDFQKAKSLVGFGVSQAETKEKIKQNKEQAVMLESQHLILSESEKEETPHPPELKFSSLSEENKKEIESSSPQATASELKPSLLPEVIKEEVQSDSPLLTKSVPDSVLSKARKEEVGSSSPPTEHKVLNEKEKEAGEPGPSSDEKATYKSPIWSEVDKEGLNFHASLNARYSAEYALLSEVVKEEEKSGSSMPEHSVLAKMGSDQGVPPLTVPEAESLTLSKQQASESSIPASVTEGLVPPYMAVEMEKKNTILPSSKIVISVPDQGVTSQEKEEIKEEIKYPLHESETLRTEELSMKSITQTGEKSHQETGTLMSDKPAVPLSSDPVEPEKIGVLPLALELSGVVSALSQGLESENEYRDTEQEISLTSETGNSVLERTTSEPKTREGEKQEYNKPFTSKVASMVSDESVASFIEKENPQPQQDHFSLKELLQESRDLADSNKGEKQKGYSLSSIENVVPQGTGNILSKTNEDIVQTRSFPISENISKSSKIILSDLSEEQAKQKMTLCPDNVANLPDLSKTSLSKSFADQQDIATKSHCFVEANLPLDKSKSIVTIEPRDVKGADESLPLQKEGIYPPKETSQKQVSSDKERELESGQPISSATDGRLPGQLLSAPPRKKQTYEHTKQESLYPAKEPDLTTQGLSPLSRSDDHREKPTTQPYSSPEIQIVKEPRGTVLAENVDRPEVNAKQLSSSVDPVSVVPEKLGTEEDGQKKFTPTSESATRVQMPVFGDHIREQIKHEIIPSSIKATSGLAEDSVTILGSEKEDMGSVLDSSTEKRWLGESKSDTPKVEKNVDEAQQSKSEKLLPEAKISKQEKSKLSLIQSGEISAPLDSPEIINKVPEQAKTAASRTVTESTAKKGVSSFTSWMASLFFGASVPENNADEKEAQLGLAADIAVMEGEVKMAVPVASDDFNEAEKPALSPLSVSGLLPEKEPKDILMKAREEREQKETPLPLPNQIDKEPSELTLLRGDEVTQNLEPLPSHHLPESRLSGKDSRTAVTESGKPRQSKEEPLFLSSMKEIPPELSKPISETLIEDHKMPEKRKEEMQSLSGKEVEKPSEEPSSVKVTSAQNRTYLEIQPPLLEKQLVSEEVENGAPIHITSDNRLQKAEIYTSFETSQLMEDSKTVSIYPDKQYTVSPEEEFEQNLSPGENNQRTPLCSAGRTSFAPDESVITFDISHDEVENLKNQTSSLAKAKSVTRESQMVLSVAHSEIKEAKPVGIQPTSLRETDSLEEKPGISVPSSTGPKTEVDQEEIRALPDTGSLTPKIQNHNEEQHLLSSDKPYITTESPKDASPNITKESKRQESQSGTFGRFMYRESDITLDHSFDETRGLDQLSSFLEAVSSPVKSPAVISASSPKVNESQISEISPPELTGVGQTHRTKDGAPDSSMLSTFVSKQVADSQTKPMGDIQVDKPYPSAIHDSDRVIYDIPSTNVEEISSIEGILKEPENFFAKEGEFAVPVTTSKPPGLTEDQKNAFSIISEGCEILNIHAPAFISSVDEEECEKMQDKLEYLKEKTSKSIQSFHDGSKVTVVQETETVRNESHAGDLDTDMSLGKGQLQEKTHPAEEDISTDSDVAFSYHTMSSDVDYFEKYTLIDYNISPDPMKNESFQRKDLEQEPQKQVPEETISFPESSTDETPEYEFDLVKLDESFYGMEKDDDKVSYTESQPSLLTLKSPDSETPRDIAKDVDSKSPGMPLFNAEEGVLSRTQLFPTEVKAVNPELLEEPPALAFLYKDLYEEAVGDKKKEDETTSDKESLTSDASFAGRHSDAEEVSGLYFEKYILKDDILHDTSGYQKEQSQPLEGTPVDKEDSCQLIAGGEVLGRFGTILGERSMEEDQKAIFGEGELISKVESHKDEEVQGKVPITEEIQLTSQKISYAVPFQDTHHILERVDEPDSQGNEEESASPEASQHLPVEVSYPEEEFMSGAAPIPESLQVEPQILVPSEMKEGRPCSSPVQDEYEFAELENYEVVTHEDLLSDDLLSEATPEDVLSQGRESSDRIGKKDEFVKEVEESRSIPLRDLGSEVVEPELLLAEAEDAQKEAKKSQIDTFCYTCKCPISAIDKLFGAHKDHEVAALDTAIDVVKIQLGEFLENLKEKSLKIEAFVTEIESFFNIIEENCSKNEKRLEEQNEEMMKKVLAQYDEKAQSFEEVKKRKMEYLHEQMVNFLQSMDTAKETLETIVKEAEELDETVFLTSFKEINDRLLSAMESTASLENIPTAFSLFEHYDDSSTRSDQMLKHVAVPQPPILEPQEPNSATSTTITVYWSVRKEDVIESFQVYCMEEPQEDSEASDLVEEYRLTVKESYCLFEDLEPGRCYQVWVMAVNFTGCSLPSERATFKTAPSTPIIKAEDCTVCWNTATIRWSSANPRAADAYTLEYCRQHSPEGEGLRSYSGIKGFQLKVNLQPNDNYFFYAKAVNAFGTSEQSEAALISTRGTRFLLLRDTAHPALQISLDGTVIRFTERRRLTETPSVLGEQLPACGQHYWETTVADCPAYRLGICSSSNVQGSALGQGDTSWYMHCSEPQRYKFFSNGTVSNVHVTEQTVRVGILLDYSNQRLLFINAESGQLLFTIRHRFTGPIHPAFALEKPGQFTLHLGKEPPDFLRHK